MTDPRDGCQHYYADPSGGFGWPSCVKCGTPCPIETAHRALRPCCNTTAEDGHTPTCQSVDARQRRGQTPFPTD